MKHSVSTPSLTRKDRLPANVLSCSRLEGFPVDYSLIVVGPLGRKLAANPSLTVGGVMLSVTIQYSNHTFAALSVVWLCFRR